MYKMSEDELKWQRREDARTLARAEQIKADKERYKGAIAGAREIAQEEVERVKGIAKIAGVKVPSVPKNEEPIKKGVSNPVPTFGARKSNPATVGRL